jgi:guanylate kinase
MTEQGRGTLLVLSAPTGGGKTTIAHRLVAEDPRLRFSISHTTREPRPGEREGVDYHFVTEPAFESMAEAGEFLEWARVHGHRYGTHRSEKATAALAGQDLILDIDVQGGLQVKAADPEAVLVFILPPSLDVLLERLSGRMEEPEFDLRRRLSSALTELELATNYDYNLLNEDLDRAVGQVRCILESARLRPVHLAGDVAALRQQIAEYLRSQDVHRG